MGRVVQESGGKGSLKDIQILINENASIINNKLKESFESMKEDEIIWTSPIKDDDYAEYSDDEFLTNIGLTPSDIKLIDFWPRKGPQWDALAKTKQGKVILVEAKANIPEVISPPTRAGDVSKKKIVVSLNEVKKFLEINIDVDWSARYYQYANRLAHLYFLREKCKQDTYLVNVYFMGDKSVSGPDSIEDWKDALETMYKHLGISDLQHKLSDYMVNAFIDVKDISGVK